MSTSDHSGFKPRSQGVIKRYLSRKRAKKRTLAKALLSYISGFNKLQSEIDLWNQYSTDAIYRLRYNTMKYDYISPSIVRLLGYSAEEVKTMNLRSLILETQMITGATEIIKSYSELEENRKEGKVQKWQADYLMLTKDGKRIWVSDVSHPWFDEKGAIIGSIGSLRDITDRVEALSTVEEAARHAMQIDEVTGIKTRPYFFERLDNELKRIQRNHTELSILVIEVDHFQDILDGYGAEFSNIVLKAIAKKVYDGMRCTDEITLLSGGEFGVILPDTLEDGAIYLAEKIQDAISKQTIASGVGGASIGCTVSIGVAMAKSTDEIDAASLYKVAGTRLFIAKSNGQNQIGMDSITQMH
jgi:diguanylate cyclase (GGDEF)-like protein/PAS domain S-box-containing protein